MPANGTFAGPPKGRMTTLGQGMGGGGGLGRKGSQSSSPTSAGPAKKGAVSASSTTQPPPAVPSLMSIVDDVARVNREGWSPSAGGGTIGSTHGHVAGASMVDLVRAPPRVGREALAAMVPVENRFIAPPSGAGSRPSADISGRAIGLVEIRAPGSVFEERYRQQAVASASTPNLIQPTVSGPVEKQTTDPRTPKHPTTSNAVDKGRRSIVRRSSATNGVGASSGADAGQGLNPPAKTPLRSALRNPSPSPSPSPVPGPSSIRHSHQPSHHGPAALNIHQTSPLHDISAGASLALPAPGSFSRNQAQRSTRTEKGKGKAPPESGDESADDSASGTEVFYSDEELVELASPNNNKAPNPALRSAMNGHNFGNGHAAGYGSEQSESTTSTAQANAASSQKQQVPRRRKSVRVSLQPTFSPSPPAIEYDEEEAKDHAPWVWRNDFSEVRQQPHHYQPLQQLAAPVPVSPAKQKSVAAVVDMWMDSSDDDEEYKQAKVALTRAAKHEKDVSLLVKNRSLG